MKKDQIIVIPAYKPGANLISLVEKLSNVFSRIIIVDDGGGKEFQNIFDQLESIDSVIVCRHAVNMGKGRALKTAFNYILCNEDARKGCITVDADGQHLVDDIVAVANAMEENYGKLILGVRAFRDKTIPFRSRFGNAFSRIAYRYICGIRISDTQTGLRGIPYNLLMDLCVMSGERYEYETSMLLKAKEKDVPFFEVPIATVYDEGNSSSHFNPLRDSMRIYSIILKYMLASFLAVIVDFTIFNIAISAGIGIVLATYIGRYASAVSNFIINKNFVFKKNDKVILRLISFFVLVNVSGAISAMLVSCMGRITDIPLFVIKAVVEGVLFFANYLIQSRVVYK